METTATLRDKLLKLGDGPADAARELSTLRALASGTFENILVVADQGDVGRWLDHVSRLRVEQSKPSRSYLVVTPSALFNVAATDRHDARAIINATSGPMSPFQRDSIRRMSSLAGAAVTLQDDGIHVQMSPQAAKPAPKISKDLSFS